ncbi:MAG: hypothetical protein JXR88_03670 [Clostridia bacterium]|nr:hypothetical protein [Clostridia bacterium]
MKAITRILILLCFIISIFIIHSFFFNEKYIYYGENENWAITLKVKYDPIKSLVITYDPTSTIKRSLTLQYKNTAPLVSFENLYYQYETSWCSGSGLIVNPSETTFEKDTIVKGSFLTQVDKSITVFITLDGNTEEIILKLQ